MNKRQGLKNITKGILVKLNELISATHTKKILMNKQTIQIEM